MRVVIPKENIILTALKSYGYFKAYSISSIFINFYQNLSSFYIQTTGGVRDTSCTTNFF